MHKLIKNGEVKTINYNEIKKYVDVRYIGPVEACWRILNKDIQNKSHAVIGLSIHLENEQEISFDPDDAITTVMNKNTIFMAYFKYNLENKGKSDYIELLYLHIPKNFTWDNKIGIWKVRKAHFNTIGRIYSITPKEMELYHLKILLLHVKGATSHKDLKTINGVTYQTNFQACSARGLI